MPRSSVSSTTCESRSPTAVRLVAGPSEDVAVAVEVQRESRACPDIDQHELATVADERRERRQQVGTTTNLVHLVAMAGAQLEQSIAVLETELPVELVELWIERRLRLADLREAASQRHRLELEHEERGSRLEQQRWQPVRRDRRGELL